MDLKKRNILIIGNGSGGHFFPSLRVAEKLKDKGNNIHYVVAKNRLDSKIIKSMVFPFIELEYLGLKNNYFRFIKNQINNIKSVKRYIINNKIDLIIGFGGGLSFSCAVAGLILKIKVIIHEQNSILGRANKLLKNNVLLLSSYEKFDKNALFVGNPIVDQNSNKNKEYFDVIIVFGSQGSSSLNKIFDEYLKHYDGKYRILFVCNNSNFIYKNKKIVRKDFVNNLKDYYCKSRLVICRAGATTLAELSMFDCKVVVIPSPYVVNNHQEKNAIKFKEKYGCQILNEKEIDSLIINKTINDNLNEIKCINKRKSIEKENFLNKFIEVIENEI
ncbi:MAG: UDP-N-acetylglucosamine--N-acetylmuramyl-(pentapeptide) pyrophosphoryl-undecaprenol N-acetylglucosamine transferase [Bacilli bacterium]|nr:UDP-N-acetylglucosamine--N-acetylmuramyl-(pentapeptide) pyrophosphoryl-undecaprenol N-acetylglucosamine transferase [Bacilli bacterium]